MKKYKKRIIVFFGACAILIFSALIIFFILFKNEKSRINALKSPIVQFGVHTYRSLVKIVDLPYFIYLFHSDSLPTYELVLSPEKIALMNQELPTDMIKGRLTDEHKVKVKSIFRADGYQESVDIRYRGRGPNHWNALKKSYQIDYPDNRPFASNLQLKFNIPEDRQYIVEPLNFYRAKKMDLFAPQPWFAKLKLNGQAIGVYFVLPHWNAKFTEVNRRPETSNIFGIVDLPREKTLTTNFFEPENIDYWEDYTKTAIPETDKLALKDFLTIISYSSNAEFERTLPALVDMDSLYSWLILNSLAASSHQNTSVNIVLLRDTSTGKFQPIPWDTQLYPYTPIELSHHPLIGRTLAIPAFRKEFLNRLKDYVSNNKNLEDDLAFYDQTHKSIRIALYKDNAKAPLNYEVEKDIKNARALIIKNFTTVAELVKEDKTEQLFTGEYKTKPNTKFQRSPYVTGIGLNITSFLSSHSEFYKKDTETIVIGPGSFVLPKTIILPQGWNLEIRPNTNIYLGENASLITSGSLTAIGTKTEPIKIKNASQKPWGSLLVIGKKNTQSILKNIFISGGSGLNDFGITATGMLALHQTNAIITDSSFSDTHDDDAINVKHGSVHIENNHFYNTFGDAIDLDEATGLLLNNQFGHFGFEATKGKGPNGDGIDISFSSVEITHNRIDGCGDKGISVGESSTPFIHDNLITNCSIGIAIKDLSEARIERTYLIQNQTGLEVIQKKPYFGGGKVHLSQSLIWDNKTDLTIDKNSRLLTDINNKVSARKDSLPDFSQATKEFLPYLSALKN